VVEAPELAREIVRIVDEGVSGEISLPLYANWVGILQVLPYSLQRVARWVSGVDTAMEGFRARGAGGNGSKKEE
jgi:hypothetical protein